MRYFKKYILVLLLLLSFIFVGCNIVINNDNNNNNQPIEENKDDKEEKKDDSKEDDSGKEKDPDSHEETKFFDTINIYAVNDFHGMIFETSSGVGLSKLGKYLHDKKEADPAHTIILSAGDMFQGSAVSSMSRGRVVVDAMNYIGFDAMTLGNHEFDWGIEEVLKYTDGNETNGEMDFPYVCANAIDKRTNNVIAGVEPYTVIETNGLKIGVIGIIGDGEESDILASYMTNYEFTNELTAIKKYAKILRQEEKCNIVIVSSHSDTSDINNKLIALSGDEKIDAILNGHTHQSYYGELTRGDGTTVPYVQSGCYGKYFGLITIQYDYINDCINDVSASTTYCASVCKQESQEINNIIANYQEFVDIANEDLGISGIRVDQNLGGSWAASAMLEKYDADFACCNKGGIRGSGFPINAGDMITYGDIFEIMPFENQCVVVELLGSVINNELLTNDGLFVATGGKTYEANKYYKVVTIDFLYEKTWYPFQNGKNANRTGDLFRDVLAQNVKENVKKNGKFTYSR